MESWEIFTSLSVFVAILLVAILFHALNRWRRWGVIESSSIRRIIDRIPVGDTPALEVIRYEYVDGNVSPDAPLIVLLSPNDKYHMILDQYAAGLCVAEYPVMVLKWKNNRVGNMGNFASIASKVSTLSKSSPALTFFVVFRAVTREILPSVSCAAKDDRNQWIFVSPEIKDHSKWEIFSGNGKSIRVLYSLDSPPKKVALMHDFIAKLKIPEENLAAFPLGGLNLAKQETVALGKIIVWVSVKP